MVYLLFATRERGNATSIVSVDFPERGGVRCNQWKKKIFEINPEIQVAALGENTAVKRCVSHFMVQARSVSL
jgi:hypothetical protein